MRDVTTSSMARFTWAVISTHTSHAGRDKMAWKNKYIIAISTHTSHAGRDRGRLVLYLLQRISTHTSHAGRDWLSYHTKPA